jgi:hypothetical protein
MITVTSLDLLAERGGVVQPKDATCIFYAISTNKSINDVCTASSPAYENKARSKQASVCLLAVPNSNGP